MWIERNGNRRGMDDVSVDMNNGCVVVINNACRVGMVKLLKEI